MEHRVGFEPTALGICNPLHWASLPPVHDYHYTIISCSRQAVSNNMFKKLNFRLPELDLSRLKGKFFEEYGDIQRGRFSMYNIKDQEYFEHMISQKLQFHIKPYITGVSELPIGSVLPHQDENSITLNYMIHSANAITLFWKPKNDNVEQESLLEMGANIVSGTTGYRQQDLELNGYFQAKDNEAWLLKTDEIHSVVVTNRTQIRQMLYWRWRYPHTFEEILNSIEVLQ